MMMVSGQEESLPIRNPSVLCVIALSLHLLLGAGVAIAQEPAAETAAFVQEIVSLPAEDGVRVDAVLTFPRQGMNIHGPAVVHHHGGPGGTPTGGAPRWMAEGLAARGYTCLSLKSRHSSGHPWRMFSEATLDIKAAVDLLSTLGFEDIVLTGHSLGSIRITRYMVKTQDPRVRALIHYAPTRGLSEWMRAGMGEQYYWATVEKASQAVAEGRGETQMIDVNYQRPAPSPPGIPFLLAQTAAAWLEWWGPAAETANAIWMAEIRQPMLLLSGDKDIFVTQEYLSRLKQVARRSPRVDTVWYTGGVDHGFNPIHDKVVDDTANWLAEVGLAPRPRVAMRLVDTVADDDRPLSGALYTPVEGENKQAPAFVLLHGWTGDIFSSSPRWLGVKLAQEGYTALAIQNRTSGTRNQESNIFEDVTRDIKAWIDYLKMLGYSSVILEGHSFGSIRMSYYMSEAKDPRVRAIVHLAPTRDAPGWLREGLGTEAYDRAVAEAEQAIADGKGATHVIHIRMHMPPPAAPGQVPFEFVQYSDSFLSTWGPKANTIHTEKIGQVGVPSLFLAGSKDVFVDENFMQELVAVAHSGADYVWYGGTDGANHGFTGYEDRVAKDIVDWLQEKGLTPLASH